MVSYPSGSIYITYIRPRGRVGHKVLCVSEWSAVRMCILVPTPQRVPVRRRERLPPRRRVGISCPSIQSTERTHCGKSPRKHRKWPIQSSGPQDSQPLSISSAADPSSPRLRIVILLVHTSPKPQCTFHSTHPTYTHPFIPPSTPPSFPQARVPTKKKEKKKQKRSPLCVYVRTPKPAISTRTQSRTPQPHPIPSHPIHGASLVSHIRTIYPDPRKLPAQFGSIGPGTDSQVGLYLLFFYRTSQPPSPPPRPRKTPLFPNRIVLVVVVVVVVA